MADLNLSSLFGGGHRESLNFITVKKDSLSASLVAVMNYGLIVSVLVAIVAWSVTGLEYYLRGRLNAVGHRVQTLGEDVRALVVTPVGGSEEDPQTQYRFESKYLAVQEKLRRYKQLRDDEKMIDLFGILAAILPDGVHMTNLIVEPHHVEALFFISDANKDQAMVDFASNLLAINNSTFQDGQTITIDDTQVSDITMAADQASEGTGYTATVEFTYSITDGPARSSLGNTTP